MTRVEKLLSDARLFIDGDPDIRTVSFSLTFEEFKEFGHLSLKGYRVVSENLNLDNDKHEVVLARGKYNWLLGGYS